MTQPKTETRSFQIRAAKDNDFKLEGYAATFGTESNDLGGFKEIVAPGAFARSLAAQADIHATVQHNFGSLLGRTKNGSLTLEEDQRGLRFSIQLDKNSTLHKEVYNNVRSGLLDECSFTFCVGPEGQVWSADGKKRTLTDVDLIEVAIVALPAYPGTSADARSTVVANSDLLARVRNMPADWARQERVHEINLRIIADRNAPAAQVRSVEDDEDDLTDEIQKALHERFGSTRSGAHPAHFLVRFDAARCYTRHLDSDTRCRMTYQRDDTDDSYDFGECEPDCDYAGETGDRSLAAQQAQDDEALRIRMAIAAGRTR
jgi:HK97 family phage prohead protease